MKVAYVFLFVLCVAITTVFSVLFFANLPEKFPQGTQELPYFFLVGADPGVDTETDIFRLGQVTPGGRSWRGLSVGGGIGSATSEENSRRKVLVLARGDGSEWLTFTPSIIEIPGEIEIGVQPPIDAPLGEYRGTIFIIPYKD